MTIGKTVTLTATVGTGFTFGGWTVSGATVASATATTTTFKMGDSAVNISATFNSGVGSYTLDGTITGGTNGYADFSDITQNNIKWGVEGNTTMSPWRIGGKSLSEVDRTIYSTKPLEFNVGKIVISHGGASSITVNSMTIIVATNAALTSVVSTMTPTFAANGDVTVTRPAGVSWDNCYYKIVYNVTVSATSNKYLEFKSAKFTAN